MKLLRNGLCAMFLLTALATGPARGQRLLLTPPAGPVSLQRGMGPDALAAHAATTGEVVVRFRDGVSGERQGRLIGSTGSVISRADLASGYALVRVRESRAGDLVHALGTAREVLHAEPCYWLHLSVKSLYDPYEWYLFDRGTISARAPSNFGIQTASAWNYTRGAGVTVAVVDSGSAFENYSSFSVAPGLAQTKFAPGYNILESSSHPNDDNGHGTFVTGTLAGNLVNGGGVTGVAPEVTVMPVKVMGPDGSGRDFDIAQGIRWAADQGAQVINMSLGGPQAGTVLADAVKYAASKDCVLVAAGGNENASQVDYPAGYTNCIAVGATGFDGIRAPYSNRGRNLEVVAPGGNLSEDLNGDGQRDGIVAQTFDPQRGFDSFSYQFWEGTSMAAPMVSGVAALVRAANPTLSATDVRTAIRDNAFHLGSAGRNVYYGYGLVDALAAVKAALPSP